MELLRVVFDTNVYLAAAQSPTGYAAHWLSQAGRSYRLFVSPAIMAEVEEKLATRFRFEPGDIVTFLRSIENLANIVRPTLRVIAVEDDPDDDMVLECAVAGQVHLIVSADRHLLRLKRYQDIAIIHPSSMKYDLPGGSKEAV